jgi:aryl-alcohol dehydrogenase-like predicted oxidoreductase
MSLERSLKRLQTDYIDVLLLHSDGNDVANLSDDIIATLQSFKARGLVRAIGASTKTVDGGIKTLREMDVVMACYNPAYTDEKPVLDYAAEHGGGVLLKKALASGHVDTLGQSEDPVEHAFKFAFGHPGTSGVIAGTINPQHLKDNVAACVKALQAG